MAQVLFYGASTVYGVGGEGGGVADQLKLEFHKMAYSPGGPGEELGHEFYNLGIPGATSAMLLERLQAELTPRKKANRQLITALSIGSNDARDLDANGSHDIDIATYKQHIEAILKLLTEANATIFVYGLTPVNEANTTPFASTSGGSGKFYFNQRIKEFEGVLMKAAEAAGATTLPLFEQAIQESWSQRYLYGDGLHPNSAGHQWLAAKVKTVLWPLLNIK